MKITKSELKDIVKECLVEILSEGIGSRPVLPGPRQDFSIFQKSQKTSQFKSVPPNVKEAVKRNSGGDKILESILEDTATTTLPKFLGAGDGKISAQQPLGRVEQFVSEKSPEDIFGDEVTSKWAELAFLKSSQNNK